ncbi:MAG: DMT family transporter [Gammaproteobacteria bacterium]|nr:DMT family transporter [Gammaproteobacteria bacterium]
MHWLVLALICAISLGAADALTRHYFRDYRGWELVLLRFAVPGIMLLPLAMATPIPDALPPAFWGGMLVLTPLELGAMWLYVRAIRDSPLYLTLPYVSFTPVFNVLTGYLFLGETISARGFSGILLVVLGTYLLNLERDSRGVLRAGLEPLRAITRERGAREMLLVAVVYAVTSALGKRVMGYATPESFGAFYFVFIGGTALAATLVLRPAGLRVLARRPLPLFLVGGLMAVMVVTHFIAIAGVEVAYFLAVKRSSLIFAIVFAMVLFHERPAGRHLLASVLMVAGVALILL